MQSLFTTLFLLCILYHLPALSQTYTMPPEHETHEGTWLQWPHQYEYGMSYRNSLDLTWVKMTKALVDGEKVHIIAYDATEQTRISTLLTAAGVNLSNVDFKLFPTNDVWVRDNGPIFVRDASGNLNIEDWGFNGWGTKFNSNLCNPIPTSIATSIGVPVIDLNSIMTIEGGAYELDGKGVFLACKSSILSQSPANTIRNLGMTQSQAEFILGPKLGITKFIWLNGMTGGGDITDMHIDGFAKFANDSTLVSMSNSDLAYWQVPAPDITTLTSATNVSGIVYHRVNLPLSQNNVVTTTGTDLGYKGSYINYYIANTVVLVPNYIDPNDASANAIIQTLHPDKTVIGIDVRNLYENGGMVHCVTQQQPQSLTLGIEAPTGVNKNGTSIQCFPNPCADYTTLSLTLENESMVQFQIYNSIGEKIKEIKSEKYVSGTHCFSINTKDLADGHYDCLMNINGKAVASSKIVVLK